MAALAANVTHNYGLRFYNFDEINPEPTRLKLDGDRPMQISNGLKLEFMLNVRGGFVPFGNIVNFKFNNGKYLNIAIDDSNYKAHPVIIENGHMDIMNTVIATDQWIKVSIDINPNTNKASIIFGDTDHTIDLDTDATDNVQITFGDSDVAPVDIRDIDIYLGDKHARHWSLNHHAGIVCYDSIANAPATTNRSTWIIDEHVYWHPLFSYEIIDNTDVVYNPSDDAFHIITSNNIITVDTTGKISHTTPIKKRSAGRAADVADVFQPH